MTAAGNAIREDLDAAAWEAADAKVALDKALVVEAKAWATYLKLGTKGPDDEETLRRVQRFEDRYTTARDHRAACALRLATATQNWAAIRPVALWPAAS